MLSQDWHPPKLNTFIVSQILLTGSVNIYDLFYYWGALRILDKFV